ncbi:MAG: outer membrane protein assembly factor BamA, partial [Chromatiales bacterium]
MDPRLKPLWVIVLAVLLWAPLLATAETFTVEDIRIEGLQRISPGTVFNYLPVKTGDTIDPREIQDVIRAVYKTGFFDDVRVERDGNVLVVFVDERPAIAKIDIKGNKSIKTDALLQALKGEGLAEGRVFNRSVLDRIEQELRRQYFGLGKYGVQLETTVSPLERNRVGIAIDITEGRAARIKQINVVGNKAFDEDDLLDEFSLDTGNWLSVFTKSNQYSRQKLAGDLETLRSYYLNRGFINFQIDSVQVSLTPDKQDVYITINVTEGEVHTISDIKIAGDLEVPEDELFPLIQISRGEPFSRKKTVESADRINRLLGDYGYAFANVNSIPDIDEENRQVALTFFVDPGKRVYVRRITMRGNTRTRDEVLRREFRQMESSWFSTEKVELSKRRLQRLGYFEEVSVETPAVPGTTDQIDIDVKVTEKPSGQLLAGLGFSQSQGVVFNTSISQDNFLGTGKRVSFAFNNSKSATLYQLGYVNPYYTIDGISRGFVLRFQTSDLEELDIANYATDSSVAGLNFGIPISEFNRIGLNFNVQHTDFTIGTNASNEIDDFRDRYGDSFLDFLVGVSWGHDSRDTAVFPSSGAVQALSAQATIPGSDLTYYKVAYRHRRYFPLTEDFTLAANADIAYGDGYSDTERLPFFENYFAGGRNSVRGFSDYTLGPRDSNGDPFGGNLKVAGNLELYFPPPFEFARKSVRLGAFVDAGNVFDTKDDAFDFGDIRYSVGIAASWLSPVGALSISIAQPIN